MSSVQSQIGHQFHAALKFRFVHIIQKSIAANANATKNRVGREAFEVLGKVGILRR